MNWVLSIGEAAVGYMFPQVGAAMASYHRVRQGYSIVKIALSYFSGNWFSGTAELARAGAREACKKQRDICVKACMRTGMWGDTIALGACIASCDLAYRTCLGLSG